MYNYGKATVWSQAKSRCPAFLTKRSGLFLLGIFINCPVFSDLVTLTGTRFMCEMFEVDAPAGHRMVLSLCERTTEPCSVCMDVIFTRCRTFLWSASTIL